MSVIDAEGRSVFDASYDAWGRQTVTKNEIGLRRGYTRHEMLNEFGIINMNGRLYDPLLGRFLSPDNYVQAPDNSQSFNRYSYCLNNPLKYVDPSGEFFFSALLPGVGTFIDAACWGAVIGGAGYTASVAFSNGGFSNWNWGQFGKSVGFGAVSGVVTAGVGQAFGAVGSNGLVGEVGRAFTHGVTNGMITGIQGGDPLTGFVSGGLSSLAGSAFMMYGGSLANSQMGNYAFSGLAGGVGSALTGGNFWEGTAIGLMNAGLNHLQHKTEEYKFFNRLRKHYNKGTGEDFYIKRDEFKYLLKKGEIDFTNARDIGEGYYSATINFYNSNKDLALSFGRATIIYKTNNGKNTYHHFYDRYDFDSKPWGVRSIPNEIITRSYRRLFNGKAFNIYYNKLWRK